nr:unnamed protein product [Spirometra erinaceieuropaei]
MVSRASSSNSQESGRPDVGEGTSDWSDNYSQITLLSTASTNPRACRSSSKNKISPPVLWAPFWISRRPRNSRLPAKGMAFPTDMVASSEKQHSIDEIKAAIVEGFLAFDASLLHDNPSEKSGSTAVVAFVTPKHIYFANCGDSRGILLRNSSPSFATEDHKPSSPGERRRINNAGGHVILSRVNGSLAVSRALGDFDYKQVKGTPPSDQLVSPEPDVTCLERMPEADQILCLACDGIWDVYSNEELCDYVLHRLKCSSSLTHVCNEVLDTSLFKGSKDNMSILLVGLNKLPEVDPEIVRQDEELEASIRQIIESTIEGAANSDTPLTSTYIANIVQSQVLPNYPPGGFVTKRAFVESICARHAQVSECFPTE